MSYYPYRTNKFSKPYYDFPCSQIVYKFVLTIYYPDGRVEREGEYKTYYDAHIHMVCVRDIILQGVDAKFEITKEITSKKLF